MSEAVAPLGGFDLANALRDAYGRGFSQSGEGYNGEYPGDAHEKQSFRNERDAWIRQYMARLPAVTPVTTAPTPTDRVGEDVGRLERVRHLKRGTEYEVLGEAEAQVATGTVRTTMLGKPLGNIYRRIADGSSLTVYRDPTTGKLWCRPTDEFRDGRFETIASAPAPSDPAGTGGDLVSVAWDLLHACEADMETHDPTDADDEPVGASERGPTAVRFGHMRRLRKALLASSGQIVASTPGQKGAGEEKTGAPALPTGLLPDGPTASRSSGFAAAIPSRELSMIMADVRASMRSDSVVDKDCALLAVERALAGEAEGRDRQGSVHEHAARRATPAQTPPSPPSATPEGDPPMTVEEARAFLDGLSSSYMASEHYARWLRLRADDVPFPTKERDVDRQLANDIELALRTLHAAGEVR